MTGILHIRRALLTLFLLAAAAAPARADWLLTPYLGVVFGGGANAFVLNDLDDEFEQRINLGGSVSFQLRWPSLYRRSKDRPLERSIRNRSLTG